MVWVETELKVGWKTNQNFTGSVLHAVLRRSLTSAYQIPPYCRAVENASVWIDEVKNNTCASSVKLYPALHNKYVVD